MVQSLKNPWVIIKSEVGEVVLDLLGAQFPEARPPCAFDTLDAEEMICGRANDAYT